MSQKDDGSKESTEQKKDAVSRRKFVVGTVGGLVVGAVAGAAVGSLGFPQTIEKTLTATSTATATETATKTATETSTATSTAISTATQTATKTATETSTVTTVATPSFLTPTAPIPDSQISKTVQTEVVVLGAGTAGLVCATAAQEKGAKVAVVTKKAAPYGNGGSVYGINTKTWAKLGINPNVENAFKRDLSASCYRPALDHWYLWYRKSGEAVSWLADKYEAAGHPTSIALTRQDPDEDTFTEPMGSHVWMTNGMFTWLQDLNGVLVTQLKNGGAEIDENTPAVQLVRENNNTGRVTAVIAKAPDGTYVKYVASKAVVLATGDFTLDKEMVDYYSPWSASVPLGSPSTVNTGDGHKMGLWVGAAWQKILPNAPMIHCFWGVFPFGVSPWGAGGATTCLVVNANGERYMNEDTSGPFAAMAAMNQPGQKAYAIVDSSYPQAVQPWNPFGAIGPEPGQQSPPVPPAAVLAAWDNGATATPPSMFKANTIADLASAIGVPADALSATVDRYNGFCSAGVDTDFGKRNGLLIPVNTPPYYAAQAMFQNLIVTGGLRTNTNLQVLDVNDKVIPGLYAVGAIVGDIYAGTYTYAEAGAHLGMNCVTFGYVAGQYIAQNEPSS